MDIRAEQSSVLLLTRYSAFGEAFVEMLCAALEG